jgi:hypothetical protein
MKLATKSALLSTFVLPGAGHIYLKNYIPGFALASASLLAVYYLVSGVLDRAQQIIDKIQAGDIQPDVTAITELVTQQSTGTDARMPNIAAMVLVICWLVGIIDSYRLGRLRDRTSRGFSGREK